MICIIKKFEQLSALELHGILHARAEIFVKEQNINYVDPDDIDFKSLHFFLWDENKVAAYLRAYEMDKDIIKIGRVLSLQHGKGMGTELMKIALKEIPGAMSCKRIHVDAQKQAVPFYEKFGFLITSDEYLEEGIIHVDMDLDL